MKDLELMVLNRIVGKLRDFIERAEMTFGRSLGWMCNFQNLQVRNLPGLTSRTATIEGGHISVSGDDLGPSWPRPMVGDQACPVIS